MFQLLEDTYSNLTDEQVEEAKRRIINSRIFEEERVESQAYDIGYAYTVARDLDFYRFYENNVSSVRRVDVQRIFERFLKEDNYVEVLMLPEEKTK